jgi:hypothetical protein
VLPFPGYFILAVPEQAGEDAVCCTGDFPAKKQFICRKYRSYKNPADLCNPNYQRIR